MRLIDADALLDELMERYCKGCEKRKGIKNGKYRIIYDIGDVPCRACSVNDMNDELESAPTIEPERKKGKWIHHPEIGYGETWLCSECGEKTTSSIMGEPRYIFCPMCGASMER